ncbi:hypothetical protein FN846DRAFT_954388 [Sphaerosporella brunnea]|uniref:Uncharacterized protein n=1 Tax=Sphaerosporella brunnea TaxID=1250544 RepID=A0A5J5EV63_9PEZI|nr:hypothetical protein FN846DRAFT_954388 [Sphaerosporella brunnea]
MGVQTPTDPTEPQPRRSVRKRSIGSVSGGEASDSVQITKVRKTGKPTFDEIESGNASGAKAIKARKPQSSTTTKNKGKGKGKAAATSTISSEAETEKSKAVRTNKNNTKATVEKRPKRYRDHPPNSVAERLERAKHQRMFVLSRSGQQGLSETFTMAGSTGNVYTIRIGPVPNCDCPDGGKNGTCKHILYIMHKVLKAPEHLVYQAGLLSDELAEIFAKAPRGDTEKTAGQKPLDQDPCPVCFCPFEKGEQVVWCKAQCGSNIHKSCFMQWKKTRPEAVTCVMCRQPWQEGDTQAVVEKLKEGTAQMGPDGYVNVAGELGMNEERDYSTYNPWFTGDAQYSFGWYRKGF